ncbi:MAG: Uma2 family endonuclease [Candidatus Electrothrix sp. GW3-4]|uniref:Uma2 family endonuclease n=1 Tax=Candidatus Electrothrix sp. GW3-4 TaxID=3126740 RepID=UPI0030D00F1A
MELAQQECYTWQDYRKMPDNERYELISGTFYAMSPAPSRFHQEISMELARQLSNYLLDHSCSVYPAPFDVRLPTAHESSDTSTTVLQPDISIICDAKKLDQHGCVGAPDFIAEISSPSTAAHDNITKTALYEQFGVREYWIIHPLDRLVTVRLLGQDNLFLPPHIHEGKGMLALTILPELEIDLDLLFRSITLNEQTLFSIKKSD